MVATHFRNTSLLILVGLEVFYKFEFLSAEPNCIEILCIIGSSKSRYICP